jgi:hypothetical protein
MQNSSSDSPTSSTTKHHHRFFSWRTLGLCLIGLAVLVTLIALFYAEEDWRGKHAWEKYKRDSESHGVSFDLQKLIPPPVPDDQNFAMTPFLKPVLDLNPRPFTSSPWRDTNAQQRAQNFGKEIIDHFNTPKPNGDNLAEGRMTDLPVIASGVELDQQKSTKNKHSKSKTPQEVATNFSRTEAATYLLDYMKRYDPVLDEIRAASQRPYSRFNVHYDDEDPAGILLPHLGVLRRLANILQVRASAELALGNTASAFEDFQLLFYLGDSVKDEPIIISQLVRAAIFNTGIQIIWEGLNEHRWTDAQLQAFQTRLENVSLFKDGEKALQGERIAFGMVFYDYARKHPEILGNVWGPGEPTGDIVLLQFAPDGWLYKEQIIQQQLVQRLIGAFDAEKDLVHPEIAKSVVASTHDLGGAFSRLIHHESMVPLWMDGIGKYCQKPPFAQNNVNETVIACALERYRMANGNYPDNLDALSPKFLDKIPFDVCTGQPMKYRQTAVGKFLLYSVGWNEKDDGGTVVMDKQKTRIEDLSEGDWVWPKYP